MENDHDAELEWRRGWTITCWTWQRARAGSQQHLRGRGDPVRTRSAGRKDSSEIDLSDRSRASIVSFVRSAYKTRRPPLSCRLQYDPGSTGCMYGVGDVGGRTVSPRDTQHRCRCVWRGQRRRLAEKARTDEYATVTTGAQSLIIRLPPLHGPDLLAFEPAGQIRISEWISVWQSCPAWLRHAWVADRYFAVH